MGCCNAIYKGDDTNAFGQIFLVINATLPEGYIISKAEVKIGNLPIFTFDNPVFPLSIELTHEMTLKLDDRNNVYMKVYDSLGRGQTCCGTVVIEAKDGVVL